MQLVGWWPECDDLRGRHAGSGQVQNRFGDHPGLPRAGVDKEQKTGFIQISNRLTKFWSSVRGFSVTRDTNDNPFVTPERGFDVSGHASAQGCSRSCG